MSTNVSSMPSKHLDPGSQLATVLPLVMASVPLPKASKKALRRVCRATKLSIDHLIHKLNLPLRSFRKLRIENNSLTSGLTSLFAYDSPRHGDLDILKSVRLAVQNNHSLEVLDLYTEMEWEIEIGDADDKYPVRLLGSCEWPRLRSLTLFGVYDFHEYIDIDYMPSLIYLHLQGSLSPDDVAALGRSARFASNVESLEFHDWNYSDGARLGFSAELGGLLKNATSLRELHIHDADCPGLEFLSHAELPNLEVLKLSFYKCPEGFSLAPIVCVRRPRLHTLIVEGFARSPGTRESLLPLASGVPHPLPALTSLSLSGFDYSGFESVLETGAMGLESLELFQLELGQIAPVGAILARLPALKSLYLGTDDLTQDGSAAAMHALLSGPGLSSLRRLKTSSDWENTDASLKCLIESADKVPNLEEIIMPTGRISAAGFSALAAAGRQQGRWPKLKLVEIFDVAGHGYDHGFGQCDAEHWQRAMNVAESILRPVWPGIEIKLKREPYTEPCFY